MSGKAISKSVSIGGKQLLRFIEGGIPAAIRQHPHWLLCNHRGRPVRTKITGDSKTIPEHWTDFDSAAEFSRKSGKHWPYMVLTSETAFTIFDVDFKPQTPKESVEDHAARIERADAHLQWLRDIFPVRYEERSKSGLGWHIIVQGRFLGSGGKGSGVYSTVEVYSDQHGVALTGVSKDECSNPARYKDAVIQSIRDRIKQSRPKREKPGVKGSKTLGQDSRPVSVESARITEHLLLKNKLLPDLLKGNWEGHSFASQSEADFSLACSIVEQTQNHEQQAEIFRQSGLFRNERKLACALNAARERVSQQEDELLNGLPDDNDVDEQESCSPFPLHCLPLVAAEMAKEVTRVSTSQNDALAAACVLGILSASIGAGLEIPTGGGRTTRSNLFILAIAASGTGKSETFGFTAKPFLESEAEAIRKWETGARPLMASKLAMLRKRSELLLKAGGSAKDEKEREKCAVDHAEVELQIADLEQAVKSGPYYHIGDATKEALQALMPTQPGEALASMSAEARGIIGVVRGRYSKGGTNGDEDFYCYSYSGDSIKVNRVGRPPITLRRPCLTIVWMIQPDIAAEAFADSAMVVSGMLPRFLCFNSHAEPLERFVMPEPIAERVSENWSKMVHELLDSFRSHGAEPRVVSVLPEAVEAFGEFEREAVRRRQKSGDLADLTAFVSRWSENNWRVALVLHAGLHGSNAHAVPVDLETALKAIEISRWFSHRQLEVLRRSRRERSKERLSALLAVLANAGGTETIRKLARSHGFSEEEIRQLISIFPEALVVEKRDTGGRPSPVVRATR